MIAELSGSMMLLDLPKPAFAVMSIFGLSCAERFERKFNFCCWRGCIIEFVTGTCSMLL